MMANENDPLGEAEAEAQAVTIYESDLVPTMVSTIDSAKQRLRDP